MDARHEVAERYGRLRQSFDLHVVSREQHVRIVIINAMLRQQLSERFEPTLLFEIEALSFQIRNRATVIFDAILIFTIRMATQVEAGEIAVWFKVRRMHGKANGYGRHLNVRAEGFAQGFVNHRFNPA